MLENEVVQIVTILLRFFLGTVEQFFFLSIPFHTSIFLPSRAVITAFYLHLWQIAPRNKAALIFRLLVSDQKLVTFQPSNIFTDTSSEIRVSLSY